jgi:release factor glutamine methyltransferase
MLPTDPHPDTLGAALAWGRAQLNGAAERGDLDAEVLLLHLLDLERTTLRAWPERHITTDQAMQYQWLIGQRREGWPIAYLTGQREFWSRSFRVGPGVLIPRPETELLIEIALNRLPANARASLLDLGAGSGIIALTLAAERPGCSITATDASAAALAITQENARRLGISHIRYLQGHWFEPLAADDRFDLIVSNPPYIAAEDPHLGQGDLRYEPQPALASGSDGLDAMREIIDRSPGHLHPGGWLILEHGYDQADAVTALLTAGGYHDISQYRDLQGHTRASVARYG